MAALLAPVMLAFVAPHCPLVAQTSGDILPRSPVQRATAARTTPPAGLRPTLDGLEPRDQAEFALWPLARYGDVSRRAEAPARDGFIDPAEPEQPEPETMDTTRFDARPPADTAPFEGPPAGHDPRLFQVEDIEPLGDRRITGFFRVEPYTPVGVRIGRFVLFPQAELSGVALSNAPRGPHARADAALEFRPELRLVSNWRWHALELKANGNVSFHEDMPAEDDRGALLEARGRLDITRHANLQALASHQVTQESRSGIDAARFGARADVTTTQAAASLNHRFNRLSLQMRGGVTDVAHGAAQDDTGSRVDQRDRDFVQTEQAARLRYDLKSSIGVFGEAARIQRAFDAEAPDGLKRDSDGERYRLGLAFLPNHPRLRGEISLGWGRQHPDAVGRATVDGLLIDANLAWRVTPLTSLLLTAHGDIGDSVTDGVSGVVTRTIGLEARQALRRHLAATAGARVTNSDYRGIALQERETTARLGLEYAISREILLFSRYEHLWFDTTEPNGNWQADEVRVGMRVKY